jgi:alkanesulfonate monooxygenase SsuD/methylene tetrahydromethanopterin reductase-like flavin-dependent oxidoreductase (luciferase family)
VLLGPFVLNVMNRHPAVLARMAATLQEISAGRLRLGIGIGGGAAEQEAYGRTYPAATERAARLREAAAVMRALWTGGPADFVGRYFKLRDAWARPIPEPPPPLIVGAQSPGGVRMAAEIGDGWAAEAAYVDALMPSYLEALAAVGRDRAGQTIVLGFAGGRSGQPSLRGNPFLTAPRDALAGWQDRGVDEVTLTARTTEDVDALVAAADRW